MRALVKYQTTNHGTAVAFRSIATAILVSWWRLVARSKAHDPCSNLDSWPRIG